MTNDKQQFLDDAASELDARIAAGLRKVRRQMCAAEAYENRIQQSQKRGYLEGLKNSLSRVESNFIVDKYGYPDWAPASLCGRLYILRDEVGDALGQDDYVAVLIRLCTDNRMKEIWYWMGKNFTQNDNVSSFDVLAYRFSRCVHHAFCGMKSWDSLTQKQGEKKINEITTLIGKLSKLLDDYPVSESVLADFNAEEFGSLQASFVRHVLRDTSSKIPSYFFQKIEDAAYDTPVDYEELYLPKNNLTLSELLGRIESRLRSVKFKSLSTNSSDSGKLRYFIRVLASFMESSYGSRKDAQLAKIGNIFFDNCDLDEKRVADLFRTKAQK
ncbi:MAG: hypothetical protein U1B30_09575 [Pseudomonadota bacterium]|nr:hypothetical protein [Pseudomonadota bacterium]